MAAAEARLQYAGSGETPEEVPGRGTGRRPGKWRGLGDAYRVEAEFVLRFDDDVLQIPSNALSETGDGYAVYVIVDGVARRRPVRIGHEGGLDVKIREGLAESETVVLQPSSAITEGTRVHPIGQR